MSELATLSRLLYVVWLSEVFSSSLEANARLLLPASAVPAAPSSEASVCWTSATSEELDRDERLRVAVERIGPPKSAFWRARIVDHNAKSWDKFYHSHGSDFFHDRGWLERDFPVLRRALSKNFRLLEFGCGTGASFIPLLERLPCLRVTAFDFSARAISLAQNHPTYVNNAHRACAFVGDGAAEGGVVGAISAAHCAQFPPDSSETASFDAVLMLYMISAMPLETHARIFMNAAECLKPGGLLMLRDYGHGDEAQTRFGRGAKFCEDGSVMVRRDGTLAAFLRIEDLSRAAAAAGLEETGYDSLVAPAAQSNNPSQATGSSMPAAPTSGLSYLYRSYSNRATGENLQRVWVHGIWRKPSRLN